MANNEDYLDSLLKAAESQDNPNSAINKVREITKREQEESNIVTQELPIEEPFSEDLSSEDLSANNFLSEELSLEDTSSEVPVTEEILSIDLPAEELKSEDLPAGDLSVEDLPIGDLPMENLPADDFSTEDYLSGDLPLEELSAEELTNEDTLTGGAAFGELPTEELPTEELPTEELSIEESSNGDTTPENDTASVSLDDAISDLTALGDLSSNLDDLNSLSESAPEEDGSSDTSLDDLLNSDFSGEIELGEEDIASLLENAEVFANSEENGESETSNEESVDDLLSGLNFDAQTDGGEIAVELSDMDSLSGELGFNDKEEPEILLDGIGNESGELDEISSLLNTIDSDEIQESGGSEDDLLSLLNEAVTEQEAVESREAMIKDREQAELEFAKYKEEKAKQEAKEKKKAKASSIFAKLFKKKTDDASEGKIEKPKSKFARFLEFLTASEEEEEESEELLKVQDATPTESNDENVEGATGENKEILDEVDAEEEGKKGKKKKGKKKKGKKEEAADNSDDEESEEGAGTGKKQKGKKEKAERKPLVLDIDTGKPLSKRNVKLIAFLAASLLLAIILVTKFVPGIFANASARRAYYSGDYEATYNAFYGEKLSSSDQILFDRAFIVLKIRHKYDAYRSYYKMGMREEALDQLLQAVDNYEKWLVLAETCGATDEYNQAYTGILGALSMSYNMTEGDAKAVNMLPTDLEYSLKVYSIVNNTEYIDPNAPLPGPFVPPVDEKITDPAYEDLLDEEGNL